MLTSKRSLGILFLCLLAATVFAQQIPQADAPRVLSTNVSFGTVKNATWPRLSDEAKAEVTRLEQAARAANSAGKYGEAMRNLHHAMAVIRGEKYTPLTAL